MRMRIRRPGTSERPEIIIPDDATPIGNGGESNVYALTHPTMGSIAAKVWTRNDQERTAKVRALMENPPDIKPPNAATTPLALLVQDEIPKGYLMPLIHLGQWRPVTVCYNQVAAAVSQVEEEYGWKQPGTIRLLQHAVARNLSAAMADIHAAGHLIGDLNEGNLLINPKGAVTILDADGWQVAAKHGQAVWTCPVGRAEYTPPEILELLGRTCRQEQCRKSLPHKTGHGCIRRTAEHDAFALAAMNFRILMQGEEPFGQSADSTGTPGHLTEDENNNVNRIKNRMFRYGPQHWECCGPPNDAAAHDWHRLSPRIREMFTRAFT